MLHQVAEHSCRKLGEADMPQTRLDLKPPEMRRRIDAIDGQAAGEPRPLVVKIFRGLGCHKCRRWDDSDRGVSGQSARSPSTLPPPCEAAGWPARSGASRALASYGTMTGGWLLRSDRPPCPSRRGHGC